MIRSIIRLAKYYRYAGNIKSLNNIFQEEYFENNGYRNYHDVSENKKFELNEYIKSRSKEIEDKLKKDLKNNSQYISWFYDIIKSKEKSLDDYKEIINIILEFNKIKNSLNLTKDEKNIQNYKTFVINFKEKNKKYNKIDFPLIYSNSKYNLYKITEKEKDEFQDLYGKDGFNVAWCVVDKDLSYFTGYLKEYGDYYILWLTKNKKPFALFHNGSSQFKDIHNHELKDDSKEVLDGLSNGCKPTNFEEDLKYYQIPLIKYKNPDISDSELFVKLNPNAKLNSYGSIDVNGNINSSNLKHFVKDGKLIIKFNKVNGEFYCSNLELTSLLGCPKIVKVRFDCSHNNLTSLKGCPKYVGGNFNCSYNKLTNLDYFPRKINGELYHYGNNFPIELHSKIFCITYKKSILNSDETIDYNGNIIVEQLGCFVLNNKLTIKFNKVNGDFNCSYLGLTSLEGCPEYVEGNFDCSYNHLTSLEGCPKHVGGIFDCSYNELINLDELPKEIKGDIYLSNNNFSIESHPKIFCIKNKKATLNSDGTIDVNDDVHSLNLKYFVKDGKLTIKFNQVNGEFYCNNLKLISLEGCPKIVNGSFDCSNNKLINLKGCPEYIKNDCHCENNIINTLKYVPEFCFNLYLAYNPIKITDEMKEEFNYPININN